VTPTGQAVVAGTTTSTAFPTVSPLQPSFGGFSDAFIARVNPAGTAFEFATWLGGSGTDTANAVALDSAGNIHVTGSTASTNFPLQDPVQNQLSPGGPDSFVAKINAAGSMMLYSTYLGGNSTDQANGIAADANGNAYVVGTTSSQNFPVVNPYQPALRGFSDAFITKLGVESDLAIAKAASRNPVMTGNNFSYTLTVANRVANLQSNLLPDDIEAGDFNKDGKPDLAVAARGGPGEANVVILIGNGDGTFRNPTAYRTGQGPGQIAIADFNGDGNPDVAAGDFNADGIADLAALTGSLGGISTVWSILGQCNPAVSTVLTNTSAASYRRLALAADSIVAAFGVGLSAETAVATTLPLPTQIGGATVKVKDSAGVERAAPLFFVSPNQINYQMPPGTDAGAAMVTIASSSGTTSTATTQIAAVAPGLFTANANGQGVAAGVALRIKPDGRQIYEAIAQFDLAANQLVPVTIQLSGLPPVSLDRVYLILFGTGLRGRSSLSNVKMQIGLADVEPLFVGARGGLVGLDQVNVLLPQNLGSRGDVDVVLKWMER